MQQNGRLAQVQCVRSGLDWLLSPVLVLVDVTIVDNDRSVRDKNTSDEIRSFARGTRFAVDSSRFLAEKPRCMKEYYNRTVIHCILY